MAIPPFTAFGLLPEGTFDTDFGEIVGRYCENPNRHGIWTNFIRFCAEELGHGRWSNRLFLDGGFTSDKPVTKDIDVIIDMTGFEVGVVFEAVTWQMANYERLKAQYQVDFWVYHPQIPNDLTAFFRYVKEEERLARGAPVDVRKGLLRVVI
ncbi:hypothetical protein PQQ84_33140 [Paraburkholderia strydomiana]|uniref:DUF6932 family protein n=1 Tax=Paraburkholderia strydomiana TaxID=1245417 RepID=UPI0038BC309B